MPFGADAQAVGRATAQPWWHPRQALLRFICDLIEDELFRLRRDGGRPPMPWAEQLSLEQDLGVDSLERMALATALAQCLHLHESGIEDHLLARRMLGEWVDIAEAGLAQFSARLTFQTSGSSGTPKACLHTLASLQQETAALAGLFAGRRRILCAVPSHHIYGFLFTILLPRALGLEPDSVIDVRGSTPASLARKARSGDLVVGHPDYWQAVVRTAPQLLADIIGVTSTAPCPDAVSQALEACGLTRLFHVYGSTETAGIGWRASHRDPYTLMPHWAFAAGQPLQLIRNLPDAGLRTFDCQDQLELVGPATFRVGIRRDDAVQVGGINVFPSRVAAVIGRHPLVVQVAVRLMRPDEGTRLKAYVVPRPEVVAGPAFIAELRRWIDTQLTAAERPKAIRVGERLPVTVSGKLTDWSLDEHDPPLQPH